MKLVIAIAVMVAVVQCMPPHGRAPHPNEYCIRETGVSRDQLNTIDFAKLDASKELRCYRRCVDIKDGRLLANNMPNGDSRQTMQTLSVADLKKIKTAAAECQTENASVTDLCDNWLAMMKCVGKKFGQ